MPDLAVKERGSLKTDERMRGRLTCCEKQRRKWVRVRCCKNGNMVVIVNISC
jgi:hypothetical protein